MLGKWFTVQPELAHACIDLSHPSAMNFWKRMPILMASCWSRQTNELQAPSNVPPHKKKDSDTNQVH
jgi:hypothetical protein